MRQTQSMAAAALLALLLLIAPTGVSLVHAQVPVPTADLLPAPDEVSAAPAFPLFDGNCRGADRYRLPPQLTVAQFSIDQTWADAPPRPGAPPASVRIREYTIVEEAAVAPNFTGFARVFEEKLRIDLERYADPATVAGLIEGNRDADRQMNAFGENLAVGDQAYFSSLQYNRALNLAVQQGPFLIQISIATQFTGDTWPDQCVGKLKALAQYLAELIVARAAPLGGGTGGGGGGATNLARVEITDGPRGEPNPVAPGGDLRCIVTARHSGNLPLTYRWTATGGSFDDPTSPGPVWTAPNAPGGPAQYGITVGIRAADGSEVGASFPVQVEALPDLYVEPAWIRLTYPASNAFMEIEREADRQFILVQLENTHATATARDVFVQVSAGPRGQDGTHIGDPIPVGNVAPGEMKLVSTTWDLQGANIENYRLYADVHCQNAGDANPDDNVAFIDIDAIYYAHNGTRAFSFASDTFSFKNYGTRALGLAGLIDKHAALLSSGLDRSAPGRPLVDDPFHMLMYMRYKQYMQAFDRSGAGGHCHGFIHAAKDHFENPATRPVAKPVSALTRAEAAPTLSAYHTTQMLRLGPSMLTNTRYYAKSYDVAAALLGAESALRDRRRCIKIALAGYRQKDDGTKLGTWGHAILGFKLIRVAGRDPVLYVYDPNLPFASPGVQGDRCMTQIYFRGTGFGMSPAMTALYHQTDYTGGRRVRIYGDGIAAVPWLRDLDPSEVRATTTAANATIYAMSAWMRQSGVAGHVLRCPADAHFIDAQGRRTGLVGGQQVNEIPGAEIRMADDVEVYFLPIDRQYQIVIEPTARGRARFASVRGVSDTGIGVTAFTDIPLEPGSRITGKLAPGGQITSLSAGGATLSPAVDGVLDKDDPVWAGPSVSGPRILTPVADAHVYQYTWKNWHQADWGANPSLRAGWHPEGGAKRACLRFDLPDVPPVRRATLRLHHSATYGSDAFVLAAYEVQSPWIEGTAREGDDRPAAPGVLSWAQQPQMAPTPTATAAAGQPPRWIEFDVTGLVNQWLLGLRPNYGLCLRIPNEAARPPTQCEYYIPSRESAEPELRPQLVLEM